MRFMLGVDVGGTFTDFVSYNAESKSIEVWKEPSAPGDPVTGILNGLADFKDRARLDNIRLGTTIATNAVLERKGATVAYITTLGHRDVPFIQRGNRKFHYDMSWVKPKPLVKRRHCFELNERIDAYGAVITPLDDAEVRDIAKRIAAMPEIEAVAICLLFSYLNPDHELRVKDILAAELGEMPISASYEVLPKWKEYERASTTIADAYLRPVVTRQLSAMRGRVADAGIPASTVVIRSNGGEMTLEAAANAPVHMVVSGPTGGVIAGRHVAELTGIDRLVTLDMGGTSTDVSTIVGGKESFTSAFEIEWGVPIQIPMIDIRTIGAGGGSIAWIDNGGMLRVGPQSAGARPGPACYGHGGQEATVTDANVVLGRIDPANFLGGRMVLDRDAAYRAVERPAEALGRSVEEVAMAIVRIANNNMVGALRSVLVERGLDPREFTLCAFGGAGPLHASDLMDDAGIPRTIIPNNPGQFSAFGFIMTNARVDRHRTTQLTSKRFDAARARDIVEGLVREGLQELKAQGYQQDIDVFRSLEMRYLGQNYELELPIALDALDDGAADRLWDQFHEAHRARFGFNIPGEIIEIVNYSATVVSRTEKPEFHRLAAAGGPPQPVGRRAVRFVDSTCDTPIFDRASLAAGHVITGPAIVEEAASVTVLGPQHRLIVDDYGNLMIAAAHQP
jgi:N-methylhydantoinase A